MKENRNNVVILLLIAVIVLLLGVVVYTFLIKPAITGFIAQQQSQGAIAGQQTALISIIQTVGPPTCQPLPIPLGDGTTVTLVALECYKMAG